MNDKIIKEKPGIHLKNTLKIAFITFLVTLLGGFLMYGSIELLDMFYDKLEILNSTRNFANGTIFLSFIISSILSLSYFFVSPRGI